MFDKELNDNHLQSLLKKFPNKDWNWARLSENPNITFQNVLDYPDKPWDWIMLSKNPNITFQNVLDYPDKPWDWDGLSENKFNKDSMVKKKLEKKKEMRKRIYTILNQYLIPDISHLVVKYL